MRRCAALAGLLLVATGCLGREYEIQVDVQTADELNALAEAGDLDPESVELLAALLNDPLDLNVADADRLYDLPGISRSLAEAIVRRRRERPFTSLTDLLRVPGFSRQDLRTLRPFVQLRPAPLFADLHHQALFAGLWRRGYGRRAEEAVAEPEGYLRWRSNLGVDLKGGGLVTYRRRSEARYDPAWGHWVSPGATTRPTLDALYLAYRRNRWRVFLGSYAVGFGEGLVINTTTRGAPHGSYASSGIREDFGGASVHPQNNLFGAAVRLAARGSLESHAFISRRSHDAYQYDLRYAADPWLSPFLGACAEPGQNSRHFTCGEDGIWYSTRVLDAADQTRSLTYLTFADSFRETLVGGNVTYHGAAGSRVGVTGYVSRLEVDAAFGDAHFAPAARYPDGDRIAAVGVFGRRPLDAGEIAGELARTRDGGTGLVARLSVHPVEWLQLDVSVRSYGPDYQNPHGRGEAEPDEADGLRQRNERGVRVQTVLRPRRRWRLVSDADLWENPFRNEGGRWLHFEDPPKDFRFRQRISFFGKSGSASFVAEYVNKDIVRNGRAEVYAGPDGQAAGERRKLSASIATTRFPRFRLGADIAVAWEDVATFDTRFDRDALARLKASVSLSPQAEIHALIGGWFHPGKPDEGVLVDRQRPALQARFELLWSLVQKARISLRYSNLRYRDDRLDHYALYHLARVTLALYF